MKADALRIVGIVNGDRFAAVLPHDSKAGHIGRTVAEIDHVRKRNRPNVRVHVIVHVLRHIEQAFVDAKEVLRLLGVTDDAFRKSDPALLVLGEFAAENRAHIRREPAAFDQHLHARRNDVMLDRDPVRDLFARQQAIAELSNISGRPL